MDTTEVCTPLSFVAFSGHGFVDKRDGKDKICITDNQQECCIDEIIKCMSSLWKKGCLIVDACRSLEMGIENIICQERITEFFCLYKVSLGAHSKKSKMFDFATMDSDDIWRKKCRRLMEEALKKNG